jgi:hypothetical protein
MEFYYDKNQPVSPYLAIKESASEIQGKIRLFYCLKTTYVLRCSVYWQQFSAGLFMSTVSSLFRSSFRHRAVTPV